MTGSLRLPVKRCDESLPIAQLVGPFFFDLAYIGSTLVRGNATFGNFNEFPTHPEARRMSQNYRKLLDVMLYLFTSLRESREEAHLGEPPRGLYARDFYGVVVPKEGVDVQEMCDTPDLSELYGRVAGFAFFFGVDALGGVDEQNPFSVRITGQKKFLT